MESIRMHLCLPDCAPAKTDLGRLDGASKVRKCQGKYTYLPDGANDHGIRRADKQNNNNNKYYYNEFEVRVN